MQLQVNNIRLMTFEEASSLPPFVLGINKPWWVTPRKSKHYCFITSNGTVYDCFPRCKAEMSMGIRPLMEFSSAELDMGTKFTLAGVRWQVVLPGKALCCDTVELGKFHETKNDIGAEKRLAQWKRENGFE